MDRKASMRFHAIALILITIGGVTLYGPFLHNPPIFDDENFFSGNNAPLWGLTPFAFTARWFPYFSLGFTYVQVGSEMFWFRVGNLILHIATSVALYFFLLRVWRIADHGGNPDKHRWLALLGGLIFVLHPITVYGAGYLVQRSIVMATLFSLMMWTTFLKGLEENQRPWLLVSGGLYFLAVYSKEHAIMAPAVALLLSLYWRRQQVLNGCTVPIGRVLRLTTPFMIVCGFAAVTIVLSLKGVIGKAYEPEVNGLLNQLSGQRLHLADSQLLRLSIINQAFLFFEYLLLWLVPNPYWMSVDMRPSFPTSLFSFPQTIGFLLFLLCIPLSVWKTWRGNRSGLLGISLGAPLILFATEFSAVRLQEPFVLYRSYLWMGPTLCALLPVLGGLRNGLMPLLVATAMTCMYPLAYQRQTTFVDQFSLWNDAARLAQVDGNSLGAERIYFNRGHAYASLGHYHAALADYDRVLKIDPGFHYAYNDKGVAYFKLRQYRDALREFDRAVIGHPNYVLPHVGRAFALDALGCKSAARSTFQYACDLGYVPACVKLAIEDNGKKGPGAILQLLPTGTERSD